MQQCLHRAFHCQVQVLIPGAAPHEQRRVAGQNENDGQRGEPQFVTCQPGPASQKQGDRQPHEQNRTQKEDQLGPENLANLKWRGEVKREPVAFAADGTGRRINDREDAQQGGVSDYEQRVWNTVAGQG